MIQSNPSKKGTGIEIWGDYGDLVNLHETIHKIATNTDGYKEKTKGQSDILMSIAYDIRKAYEGSRLVNNFTYNSENKVKYYGFQCLWTDLLFTISTLRYNAGYVVLDELDQANLNILEYNLKGSLYKYDPIGAEQIKLFIGQRINISHELIYLMLQGINYEYLSQKPSKKRFRSIPNLIISYTSEHTETYKLWRSDLENSAERFKCKILDIDYKNYPEFEY